MISIPYINSNSGVQAAVRMGLPRVGGSYTAQERLLEHAQQLHQEYGPEE